MRSKIFFVSNHLRGPKGAAGTRSWQQTKALSEKFDVTVAIPATDPVTATPVSPETYEGLDPTYVNVKRVKSIRLDRTRKWKRLIFYLFAAIGQLWHGIFNGKTDCILAMSLPVTSLWVGLVISRIHQCPLVVDVRDLPFETAQEMGYLRNPWLSRLGALLENFALRRASAIICNSPCYKNILVDRGLPAQKIEVAVIGYDNFDAPSAKEVADTRKELRGLFSDPAPENMGIYCGTFGHVVEVEVILQAAERLKHRRDIGFVLVGQGQRLAEYKATVKSKELNVRFVGRVAKNRIQPICRAGDFCLYAAKPGKMSAAMLGNKVFDYLGAGKPIIYAGPNGAVSDIVEKMNAGLMVSSEDTDGLADAIEKMCDDLSVQIKLSQNSRKFRTFGYSAQDSARKVVNIITDVM